MWVHATWPDPPALRRRDKNLVIINEIINSGIKVTDKWHEMTLASYHIRPGGFWKFFEQPQNKCCMWCSRWRQTPEYYYYCYCCCIHHSVYHLCCSAAAVWTLFNFITAQVTVGYTLIFQIQTLSPGRLNVDLIPGCYSAKSKYSFNFK